MSIRVLIVDDSALIRKILQARLAREADIEVVGTASCAKEARALIKAIDPDVVTLDIEMPGMDGLSFLEKIMELRPTPVIVVSGSTQEGTHATVRALQLGAVSCYAKSDRYGEFPDDDNGKLANLVREAALVKMAPKQAAQKKKKGSGTHKRKTDLIVIGSSTGGVEALHTLLSQFTSDCPPTVIVQHVNTCFTRAIARSLDSVSPARVKIAQSDMPLERGTVYFTPGGDRHLQVASAESKGLRTILRKAPPISGHLPSVDALFNSAASVCGDRTTAILLTGMGRDGADGLLKLSKSGAYTIAQDEKSCVVFGMPRAAIELGAAETIVALDKIAPLLFPDRAKQL